MNHFSVCIPDYCQSLKSGNTSLGYYTLTVRRLTLIMNDVSSKMLVLKVWIDNEKLNNIQSGCCVRGS